MSVEMLVYFDQQADLGALIEAAALSSDSLSSDSLSSDSLSSGTASPDEEWQATGRAVYGELRRVAAESQQSFLAYLAAQAEAGMVLDYQSFAIVNAVAVRALPSLIDTLVAQPHVVYIEALTPLSLPAPGMQAGELENGELQNGELEVTAAIPWGITAVGADRIWSDFGVRGAGVVVGSIDTGVQWTHPALSGHYRGGANNHNYSWYDPTGTYPTIPNDNHGHGTHTTGTAVGSQATNLIGVAPEAKWIAAKGCSGTSCSATHILAAAEWMMAPFAIGSNAAAGNPAMRPHIINASWGGTGGNLWFEGVINSWRAMGILPVFAAGNRGPDSGTVLSPADYAGSIAVGAIDQSNAVASFSGRGPSLLTPKTKPDLVAPGVSIYSAGLNNTYSTLNGTSMAAPHVAGCAALLRSAAPDLTLAQIEHLLLDSTVDLSPVGPDINSGHGRLDCYAAIAQLHTVTWLTLTPTSGSVPAASTQAINLTVDTSQLSPGDHHAEIIVVGAGGGWRKVLPLTVTIAESQPEEPEEPEVPEVEPPAEPPAPTAAVQLSLPSDASQSIALRAQVPVKLTPLSGAPSILSYQLSLHYDPTLLSAPTLIQAQSLSAAWQVTSNSNTPGVIQVVAYGTTPLDLTQVANLPLLTFDFAVRGDAGKESALLLTNVLVNEGDPAATTLNGLFVARPLFHSGVVRYAVNDAPLPHVLMTLEGVTPLTLTTQSESDEAGAYQVALSQQGRYSLTPSKSSPGESALSALDAAYLAQCLVGVRMGCALLTGDVSGDGQLSAFDAALIARRVVGYADVQATALAQWRFDPAFLALDVAAPLPNTPFKGYLVGDVTGNWVASSAVASATPSAVATPYLRLPTLTTRAGEPISMALTSNVEGVEAFSFVVRGDATWLAQVEIEAAAPDWAVVTRAGDDGALHVAAYGAASLPAGAPLLWLRFTLAEGGESQLRFQLEHAQINELTETVEAHSGAVIVGETLFLPTVVVQAAQP